jgi:hypothetical protein
MHRINLDQSADRAFGARRGNQSVVLELSPQGRRVAPGAVNDVADAQDPRLVIIGVGVVIVLLVGALFEAFLQRVNSSLAAAAPKEDRLGFAEQLFRDGDNETAVKIFSELAGKDNGIAQYWLGHMTELGLGVPRDPSKAIELYKKAAAQDVATAELRLGEFTSHRDPSGT